MSTEPKNDELAQSYAKQIEWAQQRREAQDLERLAAEIQEAVDDTRPSITHDEVMTRMDVRIARHKAAGTRRA